MTRVQYSLTTCPSLTVVPLSSIIQCRRETCGLALTSQRTNTLRSARAAQLSVHVIAAESVTNTVLILKSNQIYLPAQNIKEKQLKNIRLTHTKSTTYRLWMLAGLKGRETALTWALKNSHKHNNDNVYNNMNFKYYKCRKNAIALVFV